jgi:hypothetical protein
MKKKVAKPKKIPSLSIYHQIMSWRLIWFEQSPDKDVPLVLDHDKANTRTLILPHKWVWHEVQEYIRKQTTSLCSNTIYYKLHWVKWAAFIPQRLS